MNEWAAETRSKHTMFTQQVVDMEATKLADQQQILQHLDEQGRLRQQLTHAEKGIVDRAEKSQHALCEAQMKRIVPT